MIGFINVDQPFLAGAAAAARAHDVNLICYVGKNLNVQDNFEYQGNILYRFAAAQGLDGVVTWAGTGVALGQYASEKEIADFFESFAPLPIVNYEKFIPGLHTIRTDTTLGMEAVLRHLVQVHGRRRILLVRGPTGHIETEDRVRAYQNVMAEVNIPIDPNLMLPPINWGVISFEGIIGQHIDQRRLRPGVDFDAVAGTEPHLACATIRFLQTRGVVVPGEVAVVGFNETPDNTLSDPPLTTARKPFFASGYRAVESVLDLIAGKTVPDEILIPAEVILRRSCGCVSQTILEAGPHPQVMDEDHPFDEIEKTELGLPAFPPSRLLTSLMEAAEPVAALLPHDWLTRFWNSFVSDLSGQRAQAFIEVLNDLVSSSSGYEDHLEELYTQRLFGRGRVNPGSVDEDHLEGWNRILTLFRYSVWPSLKGKYVDIAETLWQQAQIVLAEINLQKHQLEASAAQSQHYFQDLIGEGLNSTISLDELIEGIIRILSQLQIPTCYFSLYTDPHRPESTARLVLAYHNHLPLPLPASGRVFPSWQLVPADLLPSGRNFVLVVEPLYYRERQLGFMVFEMVKGGGGIFELLQNRVSNILDRLLVERDVREREAQFQAMAEASPIGIFMVDMDGSITYQNPVMQAMSQQPRVSPEDSWLQSCDPTDRERITRKWEGATRQGQAFSDIGRYRTCEGCLAWWDVRMAAFQVGGKTLGYVGMVQDISESLQMEAALKASEERYRRMVEGQAEGVGFISPDSTFQFINQAGEAILGVPQGTLTGRRLLEFLDEAPTALFDQLPSNSVWDQPGTHELSIRRPDGVERQLMITTAPSFDSNQVFLGSFCTFRDITERKQHEDQLYYLSMHDSLTGLHNRAYYEETLARLQRTGQALVSVIVLDVDGLKKINDTLGHAAGDMLLRRVAQVLRNTFRSDDVVARIGGDEFVVILPGTSATLMQTGIERLKHNLNELNKASSDFKIHLSIGGATAGKDDDLMEVIHQADRIMYIEKTSRKSEED